MTTFESLQEKKFKIAIGLYDALPEATARLFAAEVEGKPELAKEWLVRYAAVLKVLLKTVESQQNLCPQSQCASLLQAEIDGLKGAIRHVEHVAKSTDFDSPKIREVLRMITSRQHSLPWLLREESAAA